MGYKFNPFTGTFDDSTPGPAGTVSAAGSGTAAAPGIAFASDLNTGIYSPGADQVAVATNGTGRLFVDASGNVGVGTNIAYALGSFAATGSMGLFPTTTNTVGSFVSFTSGLGSASSETIFKHEITNFSNSSNYGTALSLLTRSTTAAVERLRITSAGNVGIGTTSPAALLTTQAATSVAWNTSALFTGGSNGDNAGSVVYIRPVANSYGGAIYGGRWSSTNRGIRVVGINQGGQERSYVHVNGEGDTVEFATATAERARIDSSGRFLVGTSSTSGVAKLQVQGYVGADTGFGIFALRIGSTPAVDQIVGRVDFNDSDDLTGARISANRDTTGTWSASSKPSRLVFSTTADGAASPTERMRITSGGSIFVGNTGTLFSNTGVQIDPVGKGLFSASDIYPLLINRQTSDGTIVDIRRGWLTVGTISVTTTATAYNTSSDYRLKENVVPLTGAIDRVNDLQVRRFNFTADPDKTVDGFIAHEAQAVVPECVTGEKDAVDDDGNPVYQGIDQAKLVPLLTAALQEAIGEIESLKARVAALESE